MVWIFKSWRIISHWHPPSAKARGFLSAALHARRGRLW